MQQNRRALQRCRCHKITPEKSQRRVLLFSQSKGAVSRLRNYQGVFTKLLN
jgi:hypothetical protein